jgi:hypothetical protein
MVVVDDLLHSAHSHRGSTKIVHPRPVLLVLLFPSCLWLETLLILDELLLYEQIVLDTLHLEEFETTAGGMEHGSFEAPAASGPLFFLPRWERLPFNFFFCRWALSFCLSLSSWLWPSLGVPDAVLPLGADGERRGGRRGEETCAPWLVVVVLKRFRDASLVVHHGRNDRSTDTSDGDLTIPGMFYCGQKGGLAHITV